MDKYLERANELKSSVVGNYEHSTDIQDEELVDWLIEQAEKVKQYEKSFQTYTDTLNQARGIRDKVKNRLSIALKEIKLRKQYESFLKSVIRSGETLKDECTFEWFCDKRK